MQIYIILFIKGNKNTTSELTTGSIIILYDYPQLSDFLQS